MLLWQMSSAAEVWTTALPIGGKKKKNFNAVEVWKEIAVHPFIYNHWTQIVSFLLTLPVAEIYERYTGC